jgi:hypothetical protein
LKKLRERAFFALQGTPDEFCVFPDAIFGSDTVSRVSTVSSSGAMLRCDAVSLAGVIFGSRGMLRLNAVSLARTVFGCRAMLPFDAVSRAAPIFGSSCLSRFGFALRLQNPLHFRIVFGSMTIVPLKAIFRFDAVSPIRTVFRRLPHGSSGFPLMQDAL